MNRRQFLRLSSGLALAMTQITTVTAKDRQPPANLTGFVYDSIYLEHILEPGHPESPERLQGIMAAMKRSGLLEQVLLLEPLAEVLPHIYQIHTREHVQSIQTHYGRSHDVAAAAVGGALAAVQAVCQERIRNAFCAVRPPGHHARNTGREEGFCLYNTVAVAARYAQRVFHLKKILIVDWDYHHGNATEEQFYADQSVLYFSTHDQNAYPGTGYASRTGEGAGAGYNINVPLACGATDADIIRAFKVKLLPAAHKFKPDLILISAGFDSRKDDLLGCFAVTDDGYVKLTQLLMQLADQHCNGRIVSVLEGGYNVAGLASAVVHHVKTLMIL